MFHCLFTSIMNTLKQAKLSKLKSVKNAKILFGCNVVSKDQTYVDTNVLEVNSYLKNYFRKNNIDFPDNTTIEEDHRGVKKATFK